VVTGPIVDRLAGHMPRALAAVIVLLGVVVIAGLVVLIVLAGVNDQRDDIQQFATKAVTNIQHRLGDLGVDSSSQQATGDSLKQHVPEVLKTLLHGVVNGISGLVSIVFGLSLAALSFFFLLKDGPSMRDWINGHLGLPRPVASTITGGLGTALRGYFRGVTLIALFNGIVVTIGAVILDVPLAGTIGVVTFATAYVPFIGAFVAGAFAVVIALGAHGTTTAILMLLVVLLANGLLQNIVQPFAMGAALRLNPLVVLVATIGAGCLFGTIGLVLAGPLVSAAVHIPEQLRQQRAAPT